MWNNQKQKKRKLFSFMSDKPIMLNYFTKKWANIQGANG